MSLTLALINSITPTLRNILHKDYTTVNTDPHPPDTHGFYKWKYRPLYVDFTTVNTDHHPGISQLEIHITIQGFHDSKWRPLFLNTIVTNSRIFYEAN